MSESESVSRSAPTIEVALQNPTGYREVGSAALRLWLRDLLADLSPACSSIAVRLVDDKDMRRLNRTFRRRDETTDVLSFPGDSETLGGHVGDIAVSVPAARRQALEAGHSFPTELKILLLHGVLHCLGHDHEVDEGQMEALERRLRCQWIETDA